MQATVFYATAFSAVVLPAELRREAEDRWGFDVTNVELARAEVGAHSIAYRVAGRGPALILLHGFLCDSRCWRRQLRDLSDLFTVVAWDAPGAGASPDPPDPFTFGDWARCLDVFLDAIGVARAHMLGLSWGGVLAQEFWRLHPYRVSRLILVDTYAGWKGSFSESVCQQRLARCERDSWLPPGEFVSRWVPEMFTEGASADLRTELASVFSDFHPVGFRLMAKSLADADTMTLLPRIDVPTLLLWGDDDQRSPVSVAERLRDAIPGAELSVVPNAGHISNMEQPDLFNREVRRFCS